MKSCVGIYTLLRRHKPALRPKELKPGLMTVDVTLNESYLLLSRKAIPQVVHPILTHFMDEPALLT